MTDTGGIFGELISSIEAKAKANIQVNEGDYIGADGLLYCHKCDTPKQCRVELFGSVKKPMCLCKCAAEERNKNEAEFKHRQKVLVLQDMAFSESEMLKWTFENDDLSNPKISQVAKNYVKHFDEMKTQNKGLLFFGPVGTGKTYITACMVNELIEKEVSCLMTNFSRLVNTLSGMYQGKQEYIDSLNRYKLLVIDDLAAERNTEYVNEIVQNIIDSRYRAGLPLIITTNLTGEELKNPADISKQRTYSRLLEVCIPVEVEGKDRRREKLKESHKELKDLLGL